MTDVTDSVADPAVDPSDDSFDAESFDETLVEFMDDDESVGKAASISTFELEPYRRSLKVEVLAIGQDEGRLYAVLDDTVLYPEGGGQPSDHGVLRGTLESDARIIEVRKVEGEIRHYLDGDLQLGDAEIEIDWARRYDHMQQHTAQHLLSAVAADRFGWPTTSFHLRETECDIELAVESLDDGQLQALEEAVMDEVRAAHAITSRRVPQDALSELPLRTRGLPAGHVGDVRLVEIEGLDLNNCGGTHLRSSAEIESIKLLSCESRRGGTRLLWIAGKRVRQRLGDAEERQRQLRLILGAADDELAPISLLKLDQLRALEKANAALLTELADLRLEDLLRRDEPWVCAHFDGVDMPFLQRLARAFLEQAGDRCAFLTASKDDAHCFVLARGESNTLDLAPIGKEVAQLLDGRGGGRGTLFQGKAATMAKRQEAVELVQSS